MNIMNQKEVIKETYCPPKKYNYTVYNAGYSSSGNLCYQSTSYEKKPNKAARAGAGGVLGGVLGGGGVLVATFSNPVGWAIAAGAGVGFGIGALFGLFSK